MEIITHVPGGIIDALSKAIEAAETPPRAVNMTFDEYAQLKEEIGAPPNAVIPQIMGLPLLVDSKPAETVSSGIVVAH